MATTYRLTDEHNERLIKDGERFDQVAFEEYGDPFLFPVLLRANPELGLAPSAVLEAGGVLKVPVLEEVEEIAPAWVPWQES
jgi:hypothetical protein